MSGRLLRRRAAADGAAVDELAAGIAGAETGAFLLGRFGRVRLGSTCWSGLLGFGLFGGGCFGRDRDRIGFDLQNSSRQGFFARCLHFVEVGFRAAHSVLGGGAGAAMAQRRRRQALRTNSAAVTSSTGSARARVDQSFEQKSSQSSFSSGWTQLLVVKRPNLVLLREDFALPSSDLGPAEALAFSRLALI